ncbi:MAG TPA: hypothetical protein VFZ09_12605 [Archangium sp.]|uniref:hypothetical protein n=1 Tax=Archangium sp. TaxID=1872627 RepID=UPI002E321AE0|nr:hypothetical protein [Archangium sp.]HEX5747076.1 hypothetical protein [Archangium sp.]
MLALYGHPFSSYTWKALIPLYANGTAFEHRVVGNYLARMEATGFALRLGAFASVGLGVDHAR